MTELNPRITLAVLTVSDRCHAGTTEDRSGPELCKLAVAQLDADVVATAILPDEPSLLSAQLVEWAKTSPKPDLILTTGGTGLAPRDVTPEATGAVLERRHPALLELARLRCYEITPRTFLSRGEAGTIGRSLVINLPGSVKGATENLAAMIDILPHAIETLRDDVQDDGRADAKSVTGKVIRHED